MPVIPFFPNFPGHLNAGVRRRRRRDLKAQYRAVRSLSNQGLELLGSTCQSQISANAALSNGQFLPQSDFTYTQPLSEIPTPRQYTPYRYEVPHYSQSQSHSVSPFDPLDSSPTTARQPTGHDEYMLPPLQQPSLGTASGYPQSILETSSGYQVPNQFLPAIPTPYLHEPLPATPVYQQPEVIPPIIPSSGSSNYVTYNTSGYGHGTPTPSGSSPSTYDQKICHPRTLPPPQSFSTGRILSTLGALPPSGPAFFRLTPEEQAYFQQRRLPPPPPPQPRVYNFENSTQTTIAKTLATGKEHKSGKSKSKSPTSEDGLSDGTLSTNGQD
ncbi:hypothetical protein TWF696_000424 [Orbilia brochopaga]|uniref:Uncharacterized protein n=1 Tax=Orbilia brochopaga TaxID=3140254 RepID=A0AAV9VDP3_9PEZI